MIKLDYRIRTEEETIFEAKEVEITFISCSPAHTSQPAVSMYPDINSSEKLAAYDGYFSLSTEFFVEKGQKELANIFNILSECEKNNSKVTIEVKPSHIGEENAAFTNFTTILDNKKPERVSKIVRTEKDNSFSSIVFMLYKN
jgi:hypothetical protein